ncbi:hypothetical protein AAZV13_09G018700 [Glycine max]|uniref:Magnesium transporter CorA-like family protein n=1 Tax=Glycine max TaxID=3847 RepID=A0A0R0I2I3_SOYBN
MSDTEGQSHSSGITKKLDSHKTYHGRDPNNGNDLWKDGLICAFEYIRGQNRSAKLSSSSSKITDGMHGQHSKMHHVPSDDKKKLSDPSSVNVSRESLFGGSDDDKESQTPKAGQSKKYEGGHWVPIGWARISELVQAVQVDAEWSSHQFEFEYSKDDFTVADLAAPYWEHPTGPIWWCHASAGHPTWLSNAQWLHPAVSLALRDESRLISERMKHLFYETSNVSHACIDLSALFFPTAFYVNFKLFRKSIFGAADEIELKFMNRRNHEDLNLFILILNLEIRKLSTQVIRVKWSLHARNEIVFELLQHLKGNGARNLLEGIKKSTREMIEEQEADRSLRVTHNLAVFGGVGVVLTIITGLFGINVDGIPGAEHTPYAFGVFTAILVFLGVVLIAVGMVYLGLKNPVAEGQVEVRKLELQELVKMFQHEAETHAQVRKNISPKNLPPTAGDGFRSDADYLVIQ